MRKQGIFKKAIAALALFVVAVAGYLSFNVATSCDANAQCICSMSCISSGFVSALSKAQAQAVDKNLALAATEVITDLGLLASTATVPSIVAAADATREKIVAWYDTFWYYNLRPALQSMTEELTIAGLGQSRDLAAFQDAMDLNRTKLEMQVRELDSHREQRPSEQTCVAATTAGGMARVNTIRNAWNAAAPAAHLPRASNAISPDDHEQVSAKGRARDIKNSWGGYIQIYCVPTENGGFPGCGPTINQGRDVDIAGEIFSKSTIDLTDQQTQFVINDMNKNLVEPFISDPLPKGALKSVAGQEIYLKLQAHRAKRQAIYSALDYVISRRAPGSIDLAKPGAVNFLSEARQAAGVKPAMLSANPSHNEIMQVMMSERFSTGKFAAVDQTDEPENNGRELVTQRAYEAMQMTDIMDLLDRYSIVLAAQVGAEVIKAKPLSDRVKDQPLR